MSATDWSLALRPPDDVNTGPASSSDLPLRRATGSAPRSVANRGSRSSTCLIPRDRLRARRSRRENGLRPVKGHSMMGSGPPVGAAGAPDNGAGTDVDVAIIGGGIGGFTLALALRQYGIVADIFEQALELREVGAAVAIAANGSRILRGLGLGDELGGASVEPTALQYRH